MHVVDSLGTYNQDKHNNKTNKKLQFYKRKNCNTEYNAFPSSRSYSLLKADNVVGITVCSDNEFHIWITLTFKNIFRISKSHLGSTSSKEWPRVRLLTATSGSKLIMQQFCGNIGIFARHFHIISNIAAILP